MDSPSKSANLNSNPSRDIGGLQMLSLAPRSKVIDCRICDLEPIHKSSKTSFKWSQFTILVSLIFLLFSERGAYAATFTATARGLGCEEVDSSFSSAAASCASSSASTSPGVLRIKVSARAVRNTDGILQTTGLSSATAFFLDDLVFGIESGFFVLPIDGLGSIKLLGNTSASGTSILFSGGIGPYGLSTEDTDVDSIVDVMFPIVNGGLRLSGGVRADAGCGSIGQEENCQIDIDFAASLRLLGGTVLDENFNALSGISVSSDSGFDYLVGFEPHSRIQSVDTPAAIFFVLTGTGLFLHLTNQRRRNRRA